MLGDVFSLTLLYSALHPKPFRLDQLELVTFSSAFSEHRGAETYQP